MIKTKNNQYTALNIFLLYVLSVLGLSTPFVWYYAGWFSLVCMLPFLYLLRYLSVQKVSLKQQLGFIWVTGLGVFLIVLSWALFTNPEKWAFISGWQANLALAIVYLVFALILSLQYLFFGALYLWLNPKLTSKSVFILLPAIWVTAEAVRSIAFSIISYGPGGSIGVYWNFGVLGIATGVTPLGYLARIVGMFGLSFVVVVINLCIFWLLQKRYKLPLLILVIITLSILTSWYIWRPSIDAQKISAGFVQLPQSFDGYREDLNYFQKIDHITSSFDRKLDVLVLPEYSDFFINEGEKDQSTATAQRIVQSNGSVVTSENKLADKNVQKNRLMVYSPERKVQAEQDKTFLIPIGEYLPYAVIGAFKVLNQNNVLSMHEQTRVVSKGSVADSVVHVPSGLNLGSMACSGAIAPELYRVLAREDAQVFTNSASLGIFTKAPLYHEQSRQFARFIAISNARPYVQAASGAYSYIIDSNGNFVVRTNDFHTEAGSAEIALVRIRTFYSMVGEWVVGLSMVILIAFGIWAYRTKEDS